MYVPEDTISLLGQQVSVGLVLVYLQNWLKKTKFFPWLSYESTKLNHVVAVVLAGLATWGISISHTGSVMAGGTLTISLPALPMLATTAWHWGTQYVFSKTAYTVLQTQLNPATQQTPTPVVVMPGSKQP